MNAARLKVKNHSAQLRAGTRQATCVFKPSNQSNTVHLSRDIIAEGNIEIPSIQERLVIIEQMSKDGSGVFVSWSQGVLSTCPLKSSFQKAPRQHPSKKVSFF